MNYRLPLVTTCLLYAQIVMGGLVVGKDAGFICPDWPLCDGMLLPQLTGLVILEIVHRMTAILVGVLVLSIAARVLWKYRDNKVLVATSTLALLSLCVQILVGGMIVVFKWPGVVTTIDVCNSMVLLGLYVGLTVESYRVTAAENHGQVAWPRGTAHQMSPTAKGVLLTGGVAVLVGALFRHTGASEAMFGMNNYLASHGQFTMPSSSTSVGLLVLHIMTGMVVAFSAMWLLFRALQCKEFIKSSALLLTLVGLQFLLGVLSLTSRLDFTITTLHWANAGAIIALMTWVSMVAFAARHQAEAVEDTPNTAPMPNPGTVS